jgi:hypothetical protein
MSSNDEGRRKGGHALGGGNRQGRVVDDGKKKWKRGVAVDSGEEWSKSGEEEVCVCIFLLLYLIYC